jgi:cytochrome P450
LWDAQWAIVTKGWYPRWAPPDGTTADAWGPEESLRSIKGYRDCRRALVLPQLESHIGNGNLRQNDANLLFLDGEVHRRLRALINRILPDSRSAAMSSDAFIDNLVAELPERGCVDLVNDFAVPIAEDMTYFILGLRRGEDAGLAARLLTMSAQFDPAFSPNDVAEALDVGREVLNVLRVAVRDGTCDPGGGLALLDAARRAGELSVREQLASSVMLAHASFQNTANLLSFAACEAMTNSALSETMAGADRDAQRRCVDEVLRLGSPVRFLIRRSASDLTLGDLSIHQNDLVSPFVHDANRDGAVFDRPDEFDAGRKGPMHLSFGAGPHKCLGATIARNETLSALRTLTAKYGSFELVSVTWGSNAVMFGPTSLVAELGP